MGPTDTTPRPRRADWIAMAGLAMLQAFISFRHVWPLHTVLNYDTASYYVMARNFALGRGLVDTNLWHYLGRQTVPHPAGDYWPIGWPVVLGTLLRIFGRTERAALLVTAGLSVLLPVAVFWLTRVVRGGRGAVAPLVAGLLVVFQTRLYLTNVIPDVTMPYALASLGCVILAFRLCERPSGAGGLSDRRDLAAGLVLTVPIWFRAEAFFLPVAFAPAILLPSDEPLRARFRRLGWLFAGVVIGQALLAVYNLLAFRRIVPTTRSLMPWMTGYGELYTFLGDPSRATFWAQGLPVIESKIWTALCAHARALFLQQLPWPLPASAVVGAAVSVWRRNRRVLTVVLFVFFTYAVQCVVVPVLANADRTVMNATPWICILAALAVAPLFDVARSVLAGRALSSWVPAGAALGTVTAAWGFLCCNLMWPHTIEPQDPTGWSSFFRAPADLTDPTARAALDLHPDDLVLSSDPWQLAAVLDVQTVMWPWDGVEAVKGVIATYHPRYVLTRRGEPVPVPARLKARVGGSAWYEIVR